MQLLRTDILIMYKVPGKIILKSPIELIMLLKLMN